MNKGSHFGAVNTLHATTLGIANAWRCLRAACMAIHNEKDTLKRLNVFRILQLPSRYLDIQLFNEHVRHALQNISLNQSIPICKPIP